MEHMILGHAGAAEAHQFLKGTVLRHRLAVAHQAERHPQHRLRADPQADRGRAGCGLNHGENRIEPSQPLNVATTTEHPGGGALQARPTSASVAQPFPRPMALQAPVDPSPAVELAVPIQQMREPVQRGDSRSLAWRLEQLDRLAALVGQHEEAVLAALAADLGKPPTEAFFELVAVRHELAHTRRHLARWMRPRSVGLPFWTLPARARVHPEPLGCVLILGPWNYPFQLCLHPLVSALAAGNTAVIKPSEHAPRTAALIAELVGRHFPTELVQVVLGDGGTAARLLQERFDHIFFTGGERVGALVMAAAARHLTPVTLELGGKSPAIVLDDADIAITARRLAWGKGLNAGQTCVAPDHVLVVPERREELVAAIGAEFKRLYGADPLTSPDLGAVVNAERFSHLSGLIAGARGRVLAGGQNDPARRRIAPTLIAVEDPEADPLMQEELFGPLLPVITVAGVEEALARVRQGARPLALYLFSRSERSRRRLLATTSSGSVVFNDVVIQAGVVNLPFGGVGASGMGAYHGETGFLTFSHRRSVMQRSFRFDLPFRYPPYGNRLDLVRRLLG
jgi:aldehyde dehydrogenase (NAD+)